MPSLSWAIIINNFLKSKKNKGGEILKGKVYLVGAGPGDEGLITIKGLKAIQQADVILYDRLINPKLLESAPSHCELIFCGKLPKNHILKQERINDILVQKALEGSVVVRLKGGDPGVFGRVGEEAEALVLNKIPFEIVPGITSAIAASLYAGIPVTHREYGVSFAVITAHDKSKDGKPIINFAGLVNSVDTVAFYMGIANISYISENLIRFGKPADTPVLLIQWGTYGRQQTLQGTLANISDKVKAAKFTNPAITLVGDIVSLREKIKWFEKKPLHGRQILLPRTGTAESSLAETLKEQGADVIEFPKWVKKEVPVNESIINKLHLYDRILFTTSESIDEFFDLLSAKRIDVRNITAQFYVMSKKSLLVLNKRGLIGHREEKMDRHGKLLIIGNRRNHSYLVQYGRHDFLQTSEFCLDEKFMPVIRQMLDEAAIDTILFPSSYSVDVLMEYASFINLNDEFLIEKQICCMGHKSWKRVEEYGLLPHFMPSEPTIAKLISALTGANEIINAVEV